MYWSGCQSTGAEMRKYFTATALAGGLRLLRLGRCADETDARRRFRYLEGRTVVDLLEGDDAVGRQALLSILI